MDSKLLLPTLRHKLSNIVMGLYSQNDKVIDETIAELSSLIKKIDFLSWGYVPSNFPLNILQIDSELSIWSDPTYLKLFLELMAPSILVKENFLVLELDSKKLSLAGIASKNPSLDEFLVISFIQITKSALSTTLPITLTLPITKEPR